MAKNKIKIVIQLPHNFKETLKKEMTEELKIAQKKWEVVLSLLDKERIFECSFEQLEEKTGVVFGDKWNLSDNITVLINSLTSREVIYINEDSSIKEELFFIRKSGGWEVTDELFPERVNINHLRDKVIELLKSWSRTAVFYGVGSYL